MAEICSICGVSGEFARDFVCDVQLGVICKDAYACSMRLTGRQVCPRCLGTGLVTGELTAEQQTLGIVHRTVSCPECNPKAIGAPKQ